MTKKLPYYEFIEGFVPLEVSRGTLPSESAVDFRSKLNQSLWELSNACWRYDARERKKMDELFRALDSLQERQDEVNAL